MAKLSKLKKEAYEAGKKRDWDRALSLYEQILEQDKSNPTVINEMGDLCLKAGQTQRGVHHFLNAAAKYRQNGLTNNAVAIYKKVLRYDASNLNAHWYLAESRAGQGLMLEGEHHALVFLDNKDGLSSELQEIYLKRCTQMLEMYGESRAVLENLLQIFRMWNMVTEAGRTRIRLACHKWVAREVDEASQMVQAVLQDTPQLMNYPEHALWLEQTGQGAAQAGPDFDAVDLAPAAAPAAPAAPATPEPPVAPEPPAVPATPTAKDPDLDWGDLMDSLPSSSGPEKPAAPVASTPVAPSPGGGGTEDLFGGPEISIEPDEDDGCFTLDDDSDGPVSFDDLIAAATAQVSPQTAEQAPPAAPIPPAEMVPTGPETLDDLLSGDEDFWNGQAGQEETITREIGTQVGGGEGEDPASLYEAGMVYLEMGMHDQACESFSKATEYPDYTVRAHEMWGITLLRINREDKAIEVLSKALSVPEQGSGEHLGLLYHLGRAYEQAEMDVEAQAAYLVIQEKKPGFLDVSRRLSAIASNL
ncbi:hypothetical protein CSB20_07305 [bacterium DOLZORAL124_64_63]|nr:MAG: hypothetical protein CSB20_07305 [bacterium DOLZORAL124_64_63]